MNWLAAAQRFVAALNKGRKIKIVLTPVSTQVDNRDTYAELFDNIRRINTILLGLCQDMWRYISAGLVHQKTTAGEVGSSTMPQKVNPIDFENAEGNLQVADALLELFSRKLPVSRRANYFTRGGLSKPVRNIARFYARAQNDSRVMARIYRRVGR